LQQHKDLVKAVVAASLDPRKRAHQATIEMRDTMFFEPTAYIQMLHAAMMGKIPWKTYSDILAEAIFNMDELGNNTTKQ